MNWTPSDSGQLFLLGMAIFAVCCIVWGIRMADKRKREEGGPCN